MKFRLGLLPIIVFIAISLLFNAFRGLAGPLTWVFALFPFFLLLGSIVQFFISLTVFSFHQDVSTDHPVKGDIVSFKLHFHNPSRIPLSPGRYTFSNGAGDNIQQEFLPLAGGPDERFRSEREIRCLYRGTYTAGLSSLEFRDLLSIIHCKQELEPRLFHVYPELLDAGAFVLSLSRSGSPDAWAGEKEGQIDESVFDSLVPLRTGEAVQRVAWKRWAATGQLCRIESGRAVTPHVRIVLDTRSCGASPIESLAAEDAAMSAAYSLLRACVQAAIPCEFTIASDDETSWQLEDWQDFTEVFDASTSVIFNAKLTPTLAFSSDCISTLVISTADPTISDSEDSRDLLEQLSRAGVESRVYLLLCPPPSRYAQDERLRDSIDTGLSSSTDLHVMVLDSSLGIEGVRDVFESQLPR